MSTTRRIFSQSVKHLHSKKPSLVDVYENIFKQQCLEPLRNQLPQQLDHLDPYELSNALTEIMSKSRLTKEATSSIHNTLIQNLSNHEYGISTLHAKKLQDLGRLPSYNSIIAIIRDNPGRVSDSWELLLKYGNTLPDIPDQLLVTTLESIISPTDKDQDDVPGLGLAGAAQSALLLKNIADKKEVKAEMLEKLVIDALENDRSCLLPLIMSFGLPSLKVFEDRCNVLTHQQILQLTIFSFDLLKQSKTLLYKAIEILGQNSVIVEDENELRAARELACEINRLSANIPSNWSTYYVKTGPDETAPSFLEIFDKLQADKIDRTDFNVARIFLRIFGTYKHNTKISLELYHSYLTSFPRFSHELMFETFLALSFQGYRTSNETLLGYADAFVPDGVSTFMLANIYRILILVKSRFNIEKSLEIYNECIDHFSDEKDPHTNLSQRGLIAESLILAYLSIGEREFARIVFEGCMREKILEGPTAIKRVKSFMSLCGDALEKNELPKTMEQEVFKILQNL